MRRIVAALALALSLVGCSWYQPQIDKTVKDEFACVLKGAMESKSFEAIAADCGGLLVTDVIDILAGAQSAGVQLPASVSARLQPKDAQ